MGDWGSALTGALGGAVGGFATGGPPGAVVGAIGGGVGGYLAGDSSSGYAPAAEPTTASGVLIDQLFGIGRAVHGHGADEGQPYAYFKQQGQYGAKTFGYDPEAGYVDIDPFMQAISDYISRALPMSEWEQYASGGAMPGSLEMLDRASQVGLEGIGTGFRQDVSSLIPLAENIYRDLGDITRERFAGSNILQSSGFAQQRAQEAKDIAVELGGLQFGEDQAAADRRLQLMLARTVPGLAESRVALPFEFGGQYRGREEAIRARPYEALLALSGMQPPALTQAGYNPSQEGGLAAVADTIGPLLATMGQFTP